MDKEEFDRMFRLSEGKGGFIEKDGERFALIGGEDKAVGLNALDHLI